MAGFGHKRVALFATLGTITVALAALRVFDPATSGLFPPCPLRVLTGWYCPGCGSLRAFHQLLHGRFSAAFALNPLAVLALPFLGYGMVSYAVSVLRGSYLPRVFLPAWAIHALAVGIVTFGIVRNIPAFSLLAPGGLGLR
jgi:hypothetical protein